MKWTVTFGLGNEPADCNAEEASRGSEVRIKEEASVRGRSGEFSREGIAVEEEEEASSRGGGEDILVCCGGLELELELEKDEEEAGEKATLWF